MTRLAHLAILLALGCGTRTGLIYGKSGSDGGADSSPPFDSAPPADAPADAGPPDPCVVLPPDEPPAELVVSYVNRIVTGDVLFLVDTTGSMGDEIARIQSALRDVLAPAMADAIGNVQLSVASIADFPVGTYGAPSDVPFLLLSASTADLDATQRAIDALPASSGLDGPESQTEGLYQAATGEGIGGFVPPAHCPSGSVGYACFRSDGARIILLFTDEAFHNGPLGRNAYGSDLSPPGHAYEEAVAALRGIGAKVIGLFSGGTNRDALRDVTAVARDTGAVQASGEPLVFDIGTRGERLDTSVVDAVEALVDEVPVDVDLLFEDGDEIDEIDATDFVRRVETVRAAPADGAIDRGDHFDRVMPGTRVTFRVLLANDRFPRGPEPIVVQLRIVFRGDGATRLHSTVVRIVIPGARDERCDGLDG